MIIDIETKYINEFIKIVIEMYFKYFKVLIIKFYSQKGEEAGLTTSYFHLIFITLDLPILDLTPSANVTALQLNDKNVKTTNIYAEFNLKNVVSNKPLFKYFPVTFFVFYQTYQKDFVFYFL